MTSKEIQTLATVARDLQLIDRQSPSLREACEQRRREYLALLQKLDERMDNLSPIERSVIRLRYINGLSTIEVARRVSYSERSVTRICSRALKKL